MASLPRPSRPSLPASPQPTGPLPSIPLPKTRQSSVPSSGASTPGSLLPQPQSARTASSPSIPTASSPQIPNPTVNSIASQTPANPLRKTISYNSFPRPPQGSRTPSAASPPSSESTTPRASRQGLGIGLPNSANRSASVTAPTSQFGTAPSVVPELLPDDGQASVTPRGRQRPSSSHKDRDKVVISVRVRPEKEANDGSISGGEWMVDGRKNLISYKGKEGGEYVMDNVFTTHDKNDKVYNAGAKRLVRRVMEGYNGTVFAYGMTGTGKTYSMQGTHQNPGIIPSAITDVFSYIRETPHREFLLRVSYLEIYKDEIHDLLALDDSQGAFKGPPIKLRYDKKTEHVWAEPLKEEIVQSPTQLLRVIARGDAARKTSATQYNAHSSRSHAIVQVLVESRDRTAGAPNGRQGPIPGGARVSTLSLIDLAGSEKAAEIKERRDEGAKINQSLLALGTVISKLSGNRDKDGQAGKKGTEHINYRDDKLTFLLRPALSGNALISILCTIQLGSSGSSAAAGSHVVETLNTLKFAARARNNIVSHAKKADEFDSLGEGPRALLDKYRAEIKDLRLQLDSKDTESAKLRDEEEEKERKEEERARNEELATEMHLAKIALEDRIKHLNALILSSKSTGVNQMRSFSSLSLRQQRQSTMSNATDARSVRSSASNHTIGGSTVRPTSSDTINGQVPTSPDREDDDGDVNGQSEASKDAQIRALQADLVDKNRYIETLEHRIRQARRSSKSRVSMTLGGRSVPSSDQNIDVMLREKDAEISELREQLDDKERSLVAIRSMTRKRQAADGSTTPTPTPKRSSSSSHTKSGSQTSGGAEVAGTNGIARKDSQLSRRTSLNSTTSEYLSNGGKVNPYRSSLLAQRRSSGTPSNLNLSRSGTVSPSRQTTSPSPMDGTLSSPPLSPSLRSPDKPKKKEYVLDDMTRKIDDMIEAKMRAEDAAKASAQNGSATTSTAPVNGVSRNNSLNLLAMREAPSWAASRPRKGPRAAIPYESRTNKDGGWEKDANGIPRRRPSLLSRGSTEATSVLAPDRATTEATEPPAVPTLTNGASSTTETTSPPIALKMNGNNSTPTSPTRHRKNPSAAPQPLRIPIKPTISAGTSPNPLSSATPTATASASSAISASTKTSPRQTQQSLTSGPFATNTNGNSNGTVTNPSGSTSAAAQATEALRNFSYRNGLETGTSTSTNADGLTNSEEAEGGGVGGRDIPAEREAVRAGL